MKWRKGIRRIYWKRRMRKYNDDEKKERKDK